VIGRVGQSLLEIGFPASVIATLNRRQSEVAITTGYMIVQLLLLCQAQSLLQSGPTSFLLHLQFCRSDICQGVDGDL